MGYSGLIYAAIVAAWAAFLVPRWVRRHEEIDQAAETDAARRVRVLQRRTTVRGHGRAGNTVLHGSSDGLLVGAASEPRSVASDVGGADQASPRRRADAVAVIDSAFIAAARRRRRNLVVLLVALVMTVVGQVADVVPTALPMGVAVVLVAFLFAGRRAAVAQAQRRRVALRRAAETERRDADADDADDGGVELTEDGKRVAVFDAPEEPEIDPSAWEPVPVPRPTYLDKAAAPSQPGRAINLQTPGSWTSGRLDPAGSIELPPKRREPIAAPTASSNDTLAESSEPEPADDETYPEHRRAVGD